MFCSAGQASAGPAGNQPQQAAHTDAEGAKVANGKRAAPAASAEESQVQALSLCGLCMSYLSL